MYKCPRLLALNEKTSHLGIADEHKADQAVLGLPLTRSIVTHRLETIASTYRVIKFRAPCASWPPQSEKGNKVPSFA